MLRTVIILVILILALAPVLHQVRGQAEVLAEEVRQVVGKKIKTILLLLVGFVLFGYSNVIYAESIPDRPPLNGIYDPHHYLSKEVSDKLSSMNWEYSRTETKPQIAIAIVDNLDGDLETIANNVARNWQIGFSDTNYGMLVLISVKERKIRTETSNNMGLIIPDSTAQNLNDSIKDDFRNEDYSSGMLKYLSKVETIIKSSLLESKQNVEKDEDLSKEFVEQLRKEEKEYDRKQGRIGAIIAGVFILIFIFIGIKIEKLQKEEEEYYKWKKKYPSSSSGSGSSYYHSTSSSSSSYDSFSSPSSYDSSSSWSGGDSWSGGGFDGGGSSGSW